MMQQLTARGKRVVPHASGVQTFKGAAIDNDGTVDPAMSHYDHRVVSAISQCEFREVWESQADICCPIVAKGPCQGCKWFSFS
jgi:hypothetical protein